MPKYILIVNPFSGKKNGLTILKKLESIFENHNIELDTFITKRPGHAFQLANEKNLENYKGLLLIGGDGTFHELVNGMMMRDDKLRIPIGIIPGGTGNSFLLDLNIKNPSQSIDKILSNKIIKIDILKTEFDNNVKSGDKLNKLFQSLKEINAKLWVIEDDKRQCEKNKDFSEKFIKLSRDVHFLNDDRAKIKLEINDLTGSKIKEIKEYTSY